MAAIKKTEGPPTEQPHKIELPAAPYLQRDGQTPALTNAGLAVVEAMAKEGCTQGKIASALGVSAKTFKTLLGKTDEDPPSPARAAWEAGRAALESELVQLALSAARKGGMVQQLFLLKSQFGHRDQGPATIVDAGARINFVMPGSMSEAEYYAKLNIKGPIDARDPKRRSIVADSKSAEHPFGVYEDGEPVPDYAGLYGMRLLTPPSNTLKGE
jgi:DNA-binding CsgD family transcriptional regulator